MTNLYKDFVYGCSDECEGIRPLGASCFICLGAFINPQIFCKSISGFECIPCTNTSGFEGVDVTVGLSSWRHCRNIFHIDVSRDDRRVPLLRDASKDDRRSSSCRDTSRDDRRNLFRKDACRDGCRTLHLRDVSRDDSRCTVVEMPS